MYRTSGGNKYIVVAQDSVIGANSAELREKVLRQVSYLSTKNTKQLARNLALAEGERTEIALNVRTDDGLTNVARNVMIVQVYQPKKPSGIIWVQFDDEDVGKKTRQENRRLYVQGIQATWTPIKAITSQFAVGRTKSAQVVRKQFPLCPAATRAVHRCQGDTQSQIVVNLDTKRAIPHIHYEALSRVTSIDGLYVTDLCKNKIAVDPKVKVEMGKLKLCFTPLYDIDQTSLKICCLNARSRHKHIEDVRKDFNFISADLAIFSKTRLSPFDDDDDDTYIIDGFQLFQNDGDMSHHSNGRPYGGTAVYRKISFVERYPYRRNINGIEFTIIKITTRQELTIIGVYRLPRIAASVLCSALVDVVTQDTSEQNIIIGDFNIDWMAESQRQPLYNVMVKRQQLHKFVT